MPRGVENAIIDFCRSIYGSIGWLGVVIMMAIESAAIPLPSEVIMPLAGWLLIQDKGYSVWFTIVAGLVGALGCVIGSAITYGIGATGGRALLMRYGKYVLISPHHIALADRWFAEKGEAAAFFSRLLPVVRTFISLPAGIARMNVALFLLYTFLGSFVWCAALAVGGFTDRAETRDIHDQHADTSCHAGEHVPADQPLVAEGDHYDEQCYCDRDIAAARERETDRTDHRRRCDKVRPPAPVP